MGARAALTLVGARAALTLVGALECWTEPVGKLESTCEEQAPEGSGEEQAPEGAGEEQAPEGAGEEAGHRRALARSRLWVWREQAAGAGLQSIPCKPLHRPGVPGGARLAWNWTEPVETKSGWAGPAATKSELGGASKTPAGLREEPLAGRGLPANGGLT